MKVVLTQPVEIALRSLEPEERRNACTWIDHLKNWDSDSFIRDHSHKLASNGVYVLRTSTDLRIFYTLEQDQIVVLDIAKKATIMSFAHGSGRARP